LVFILRIQGVSALTGKYSQDNTPMVYQRYFVKSAWNPFSRKK